MKIWNIRCAAFLFCVALFNLFCFVPACAVEASAAEIAASQSAPLSSQNSANLTNAAPFTASAGSANSAGSRITGFKGGPVLDTYRFPFSDRPSLPELSAQFPRRITVLQDNGKEAALPVRWECVGANYETGVSFYYQFNPVWDTDTYPLDSRIDSKQDIPYIAVFLTAPQKQSAYSVTDKKNEEKIYQFLTGKMGLNTAAACGVMANLYCESGFDPNIVGDNGTSYGICQWHNTRWTAMKDWCSQNGYDWKTLNGQLYYLKFELSQNNAKYLYNGKTIYNYLSSVSNDAEGAYDAGYYWCYYYEVPANKDKVSVTRGNLAKNTYWQEYHEETPLPECFCSESYAGSYLCNASPFLSLRSGHGTEYEVIAAIPFGATVRVSKSDGLWAHVTYQGIEGFAALQYLDLQPDVPASLSASASSVSLLLPDKASKNVTLFPAGTDISSAKIVVTSTTGSCCRAVLIDNCTLKITGTSAGSGVVTAALQDTKTLEILAQTTIQVRVDTAAYTIHYDANGGNGAPSDETKIYGKKLTVSETVPARFGYQFLGWNSSASAKTPAYLPGSDITENKNMTLYAIWQEPLSFTGKALPFCIASELKIKGAAAYYRFTPTVTTQYSIEGNPLDANISLYDQHENRLFYQEIRSFPGFQTTQTLTAGQTYYLAVEAVAQTGMGPFQLTLDTVKPRILTQPKNVSGLRGTTAKAVVTAAEGLNISYQWFYRNADDTAWVKSGYQGNRTAQLTIPLNDKAAKRRFKCVLTNSLGNVAETDEIKVILLETPVNVTFKLNYKGSPGTYQKTVLCGKKYGALPQPKRKKYTFQGWYTKKNGGTEITKNSKVTSASPHTLYARWKAK